MVIDLIVLQENPVKEGFEVIWRSHFSFLTLIYLLHLKMKKKAYGGDLRVANIHWTFAAARTYAIYSILAAQSFTFYDAFEKFSSDQNT